MRVFILLILFPFCPVEAKLFQKIYQGYQNSDRLKEINYTSKFTELDYIIGKDQFDWKLGANTQFRDSFLEALFAFQGQKTITQSYGLSLSKNSYRFGTFSVSHQLTSYDLSNWSANNLNSFDSDRIFESRNTISYEYEILNRSSDLDWEIVHIQKTANQLNDKLLSDKDHLDFFKAYLDAKHKIILDRLYKDFRLSSQKRVNLITKRVRDGLSRQVDLDQARLVLNNQEETIIRNETELRLSVATIEDIIKVPITSKEYDLVSWKFKPVKSNYIYLEKSERFIELERLEKLNEIDDINVAKQDEVTGHSLSLNMSFTKNAFDEDNNQAFSDAIGPGRRDEKIVSLSYTMPLGFSKRDAVKEKLNMQRNRSLLNLKNRAGEVAVRHKVIKENINRFEKSIKISRERIRLAKRVVKENKRLYLRGQISFEESLRAEETLINAQISEANALLAQETLLADLAYLVGDMRKFLGDYTD